MDIKIGPSSHACRALAEGKPMSMVAFGATCGAIDIGFPGATMQSWMAALESQSSSTP